MAVSNQQILNKMAQELQEARQQGETDKVREHVRAIRLLCDLVLEETAAGNRTDREKELQTMMGNSSAFSPASQQTGGAELKTEQTIDHEEANGKSIFEF